MQCLQSFGIYTLYPILRSCKTGKNRWNPDVILPSHIQQRIRKNFFVREKKARILHLPVFFINFPDDPARIASCDHTIRNIFRYDASASDHNSISNRYSRHDLHTAANPHMIADRDWFCVFQTFISLRGIDGMSSSIKSAIGSDKYMIADCYRRFIQDHKIIIGIEVFTDMDIITKIAVKWLPL